MLPAQPLFSASLSCRTSGSRSIRNRSVNDSFPGQVLNSIQNYFEISRSKIFALHFQKIVLWSFEALKESIFPEDSSQSLTNCNFLGLVNPELTF